MTAGTVLLAGIVGSKAYGLDHPGSDVDHKGIFAVPTVQLHGLNKMTDTVEGATARQMLGYGDQDVTLHEAGKWCRLALAANPSVLELLWLPAELYTTVTDLGQELIEIRRSFLSSTRVRATYLGYATSQLTRLRHRAAVPVSADSARKAAKNARHLARLITQGQALLLTGTMTLRVSNPQWYFDFGDQVAAGDLGRAERYLAGAARFFDQARSPLPERPDDGTVNEWLLRVRDRFYIAPGRGA